ncbi:MAG: hypothetical protein Q9226_008914, partial [Calogaya cf. arnoldii]
YWSKFDEDIRKNFMDWLGIDTGDVPRNEWSFSKTYVPNMTTLSIHDAEAFVEFFDALKLGKFDKKTTKTPLQELSELKKMEQKTELSHEQTQNAIEEENEQKVVDQSVEPQAIVVVQEQKSSYVERLDRIVRSQGIK